MTTITPETTGSVEELESWLTDAGAPCRLYDPPPGVEGGIWTGEGVPCPESAAATWRLVCPTHGPVELGICKRHIGAVLSGRYVFRCGDDEMTWEPA